MMRGLAAYPSARWPMNCNHFQLAMLAYNLNCWLMLFNREEKARAEDLKHTTLATSRLRFLFLAAKIWRHGGRVGVSYSERPLSGAGDLPAPHGTVASDHGGREGLRPGADRGAPLLRIGRA